MRKTKMEKGITLIALVVTIMVLLILAVIAVNSITNDKVVDKTKNATSEYNIAQEKNKLQGEILNWQLEEEVSMKTLKEYLSGIYREENVKSNSNGSIDVVVSSGNKYTVTEDGDVLLSGGETNSTFAKITAMNYGDPISYNDKAGVNSWKVFYKDDNYLYIITSDYLENTKLPTGIDMSTSGTHGVYFNSSSSTSTTITEAVANKYKLSWFAEYGTNPRQNVKATSTLLNVDAWTASFGNSEKGIEAIGGPTLEMWVESWNEKGKLLGTDDYIELKTDYNMIGYLIGPSTVEDLDGFGSGSNYGYVYQFDTNCAGYADPLYFPYTVEKNDCVEYWIASPGAAANGLLSTGGPDSSFVVTLHYIGSLTGAGMSNTNVACRPLVAVPANLITTDSSGNLMVNAQ